MVLLSWTCKTIFLSALEVLNQTTSCDYIFIPELWSLNGSHFGLGKNMPASSQTVGSFKKYGFMSRYFYSVSSWYVVNHFVILLQFQSIFYTSDFYDFNRGLCRLLPCSCGTLCAADWTYWLRLSMLLEIPIWIFSSNKTNTSTRNFNSSTYNNDIFFHTDTVCEKGQEEQSLLKLKEHQ